MLAHGVPFQQNTVEQITNKAKYTYPFDRPIPYPFVGLFPTPSRFYGKIKIGKPKYYK